MTGIFNKILTFLRYLLGGRKEEVATPPRTVEPPREVKGFNGVVEADTLLLREGENIVLSIDFFFEDVPSWLEWDVEMKKLSLNQMGGAVAELQIHLPDQAADEFEAVKRVLLITRKDPKGPRTHTVMSYITLIVRR